MIKQLYCSNKNCYCEQWSKCCLYDVLEYIPQLKARILKPWSLFGPLLDRQTPLLLHQIQHILYNKCTKICSVFEISGKER